MGESRVRSHDRRLTKYALLKAAAQRGAKVGKKQLGDYIEWGMVTEAEEGLWDEGVVGRLVDVHLAGDAARRLERRAILVGTNKPEKRLEAMLWLAEHMSARKLKARRLERALRSWAEEPATPDGFGTPTYRFDPLPRGWSFPSPEMWSAVLADPLMSERFHLVSWSQYYFVDVVLAHSDSVPQIAKIAREELILLLTIRALSLDRATPKTNELKS